MKAVETIMKIKAVYLFISCKNNGIKALIVLKSIYLLIEWPQLILRVKFQSCDQIFVTSRNFATRHFFDFEPCLLFFLISFLALTEINIVR